MVWDWNCFFKMKVFLQILLCVATLSAQSEIEIYPEIEDQDESSFTNTLLELLFDPVDLMTIDSLELINRDFPVEAVELIQAWQNQGKTEKGYLKLRKAWRSDFPFLPPRNSLATHSITRQRLQRSPALAGWRILNKGRISHELADLTFILEQDPGEFRMTDHTAISISSKRVPGFTRVIVGDFNISWGAGLILEQNSSRISLNPGSLISRLGLTARPHYSSRETEYFQGVAGEWSTNDIRGAAFISRRKLTGQLHEGSFIEDADGIHQTGKHYESRYVNNAGLAGTYAWGPLNFFLASRLDPGKEHGMTTELGGHWKLNEAQFIQIFVNQLDQNQRRSILNWSYKDRTLTMSAQYRFLEVQSGSNDVGGLNLLGATSDSEKGLSFRLLLRPRRSLSIRYALDQGAAVHRRAFSDMRQVTQHKAKVYYSAGAREWQVDWSRKNESPVYPDELWQEHPSSLQITKYSISLNQKITDQFQYRLNLKTAYNGNLGSFLIQQRVRWTSSSWRISAGFVRYYIPSHTLRLSIYEAGLLESFNFFTAYEDGQRWYLYFRYITGSENSFELQVAQTRLYSYKVVTKPLVFSFQLSIVL